MTTTLTAITALTHAASQLLYRWLPPPDATNLPDDENQICQRSDLTSWRYDDWRSLFEVMDEEQEAHGKWPWLVTIARVAGRREIVIDLLMRHLAESTKAGAHYLTLAHAEYPEALRSLSDPPLAVTLLGDLELLKRRAISVVGSRKASAMALQQSFEWGKELAKAGYSVVSGGALGCDIAAHQGVLASGLMPAPAICVFAGGLSDLYPRRNEWIFRQLQQRQAVMLSERFWWATSRPMDFPVRNRIIAGLSTLTLVMQATEESGALITARLALDQGRDVAVLAHPKGDMRALGSAALISAGAPTFTHELGASGKLAELGLSELFG